MYDSVSLAHKELFHYTNAIGLNGIVSTGTLWATHFNFLNDREEYRLFFAKRFPIIIGQAFDLAYVRVKDKPEVISKMATEGSFNSYRQKKLEEIAPVLAEKTRSMNDPYILSFCTSESDWVDTQGMLSQWRAYGQNSGFAIVFDTAEIGELLSHEGKEVAGMPLFFGDVEYFQDLENGPGVYPETKALTKIVVDTLADWFLSQDSDGLAPMFDPLHQLACLTKHYGFREESEVRVVFSRPSRELFNMAPKEHKLKSLHHFVRDGGLVPYMAMFESLPGSASGHLPIKRVIVGPHPDRWARKEAVELLLEKNGYEAPVHVTEIPFRGR